MIRRLVPVSVAALAIAAQAVPAAAQPTVRIQGTFAMAGHITVAVHVKGEHAGQSISRIWSFTPLCSTGPCGTVSLTRSRAGGPNTLTLALQPSGLYVGSGRFYAPVRCRGRVQPRGEVVPFTITVQITATTQSSSGPLASAIDATYTNKQRVNRTRCVALPSYDSAIYSGALTSTTASAASVLRPGSPGGS